MKRSRIYLFVGASLCLFVISVMSTIIAARALPGSDDPNNWGTTQSNLLLTLGGFTLITLVIVGVSMALLFSDITKDSKRSWIVFLGLSFGVVASAISFYLFATGISQVPRPFSVELLFYGTTLAAPVLFVLVVIVLLSKIIDVMVGRKQSQPST